MAKSSQLHEEKGSGAPRGVIRRLAGDGARGEGRRTAGRGAGARGARATAAPLPLRAPTASRLPTLLVLV